MKKNILLLFVISQLTVFGQQTVHGFSLPGIEGGTINLSAFQGKKILIITLPLLTNSFSDSLLFSLDTLGTAHSNELKIIAVPAYEDGFTAARKNQLTQWYRSRLGAHIIITDGLYVRKTTGAQQHPLFKWLTSVSQNEVFDIDAVGPGYKFFISGGGNLYGVLRPLSKISGRSVQTTLRLQ